MGIMRGHFHLMLMAKQVYSNIAVALLVASIVSDGDHGIGRFQRSPPPRFQERFLTVIQR